MFLDMVSVGRRFRQAGFGGSGEEGEELVPEDKHPFRTDRLAELCVCVCVCVCVCMCNVM